MPKRKSPKPNSSSSQEETTSTKPAILRVVKQNNAATQDNNSELFESTSTVLTSENNLAGTDLQTNDKQSKSIEVSESNNTSTITSDAAPQTIISDNEQPDLPQTLETVAGNLSESKANIENTSDSDDESELDLEQLDLEKKPVYKKLETATNSSGQSFTVKEKIEVSTGNFGVQKVFIVSLYSAPDGSVWAYYHPIDTNQRQLWKRGCCRIENLRKLDSNSCPA